MVTCVCVRAQAVATKLRADACTVLRRRSQSAVIVAGLVSLRRIFRPPSTHQYQALLISECGRRVAVKLILTMFRLPIINIITTSCLVNVVSTGDPIAAKLKLVDKIYEPLSFFITVRSRLACNTSLDGSLCQWLCVASAVHAPSAVTRRGYV